MFLGIFHTKPMDHISSKKNHLAVLKKKLEKAQKAQAPHENILEEIQSLENEMADDKDLDSLFGEDGGGEVVRPSALKHASTPPTGSHDKSRRRTQSPLMEMDGLPGEVPALSSYHEHHEPPSLAAISVLLDAKLIPMCADI